MYYYLIFFFNDTATTEIYTLSLHDALPISRKTLLPSTTRKDGMILNHETALDYSQPRGGTRGRCMTSLAENLFPDRKSTRLNSSHANISYAVFCLKKKNKRSKLSTSDIQHT